MLKQVCFHACTLQIQTCTCEYANVCYVDIKNLCLDDYLPGPLL